MTHIDDVTHLKAGKDSSAVLASYEQWLATGMTLTWGSDGGYSTFDEIRGAGQPTALDSCLYVYIRSSLKSFYIYIACVVCIVCRCLIVLYTSQASEAI